MADVSTVPRLDALQQKFFLRLNELRHENRDCDVHFDVNGKLFHCHRLIITAVSPYFDAMLNGEFKESTSDTVSLKDIETEAFEEILNAIYTTKLDLRPSNVYFILKAAHLFLLDSVVEACKSYIEKNCSTIHYLIETCLFADSIGDEKLHSTCIAAIRYDLITQCKTDSFKLIPMRDLKSILSWGLIYTLKAMNPDEEESIMLSIMEWTKMNQMNAFSCEEVEEMLQEAIYKLKFNNFTNPTMMARIMMHMNDTFFEGFNSEATTKVDANSSLDLSLYLNVVDVKTGQQGWSVLKINDKFNSYVLSSFYPTNSSIQRVCTVDSKLYCFEYFADNKKNVFSTYDENNTKIVLPTPEDVISSYEIATEGTKIYVTTIQNKRFIVWTYDCASKVWAKKFIDFTCSKILTYTFFNGIFHLIAMPSPKDDLMLYSIDKNLPETFESRSLEDLDKNNIMCAFDNKIIVFDRSQYDRKHYTQILDLISEELQDELKSMNISRTKFEIIQHNGFVFVIENIRSVKNEKYHLDSDKWFDLPPLPKRVSFVDCDGDEKVLATGAVFGSQVIKE